MTLNIPALRKAAEAAQFAEDWVGTGEIVRYARIVNPEAVLDLIAELTRLEEENKRLRAEIEMVSA